MAYFHRQRLFQRMRKITKKRLLLLGLGRVEENGEEKQEERRKRFKLRWITSQEFYL